LDLSRLQITFLTLICCYNAVDLERELLAIDRDEKKLIKEIKDAARHGNEKGARVLAQSLVRLRGQRSKLMASSAQLRGVRTTIGVRNWPSCSL
jgi:division protein CdvB (Snf7/Vps24/ESCRT-III family)